MIQTLHKNRPQPAQYLINEIKRDISRLHKEEKECRKQQSTIGPQTILFTRVAGHMGSAGNKAVNKLAKQVAEFGSNENQLLLPFL
jgi:ribonuclease HI